MVAVWWGCGDYPKDMVCLYQWKTRLTEMLQLKFAFTL